MKECIIFSFEETVVRLDSIAVERLLCMADLIPPPLLPLVGHLCMQQIQIITHTVCVQMGLIFLETSQLF